MEGEEKKKSRGNSNSGDDKGKRKMKTPSQLEILEKTYAEDKYPSEAKRAELSVLLGLTDRQLQMWFCHRRLKDRKGDDIPAPSKKRKKAPIAAGAATDQEPQQEQQPQQSLGMPADSEIITPSEPPPPKKKKKQQKKKQQPQQQEEATAPAAVMINEQQNHQAELAAIRIVEEQLGEPMRDDGPVLGSEFDPLPPGAFDTPIESSDQRVYSLETPTTLRHQTPAAAAAAAVATPEFLGRRMSPQTTSRTPREHQFIPEHPTAGQLVVHERNPALLPKAEAKGKAAAISPLRNSNLALNFFPAAAAVHADASEIYNDGENLDEPPPAKSYGDFDVKPPPPPPAVETGAKKRKFQSDDAKLAKELEAQEKKLKREADKQEAARRKREEQERKEIEKMNRERQKELEKINRERQREEERQQREQKKEHDRQEKAQQKEQQRLEKLRVKEEQRRQKEAAKLQAAYERATAKKLAKLSTGLLEDEQLELMQMGAFVQGLVSGDMEGGQGFDVSKVELKKYPPASVRMKRVVGLPPWESAQNVANLVMVWRFLTTFSDAIGLWPFTVDEFVQGLHDFDSRLLNETYVALLKTFVKDVEDAAQAAASGNAGSQHAIAVAAGGHPQIVEAAYTWGFDIQEWGQHTSPLTWPEILRQFALAAGYGPRWKKRSVSADPSKLEFMEQMNDGHNANAIATLRSGAAAVNAVALMRGKNATRVKLKKGQTPKLTPGTVKYAAFHVLSIEGYKGLTILELTDRIQKSGLRDLSSSKTPEASISAALSRDTFLFERVAPSTYCVRSPYRRDTDEAEDVLQAALERTYLYQTRQLDPEKADEFVDDAEDESEGEEHEIEEQENDAEEQVPEQEDDVAVPEAAAAAEELTNYDQAPAPARKVILRLKTGKLQQAASEEKETVQGESSTWPSEIAGGEKKIHHQETKSEVDDDVKQIIRERKAELNDDEMEIDESQVGEPWVQGLMEGEFADLSIEERLNALVALVDVLNEGNTIRSVLEDRYESASALKRQLWEEVQVDKRRLKEELTKSGGKAESHEDERANDGDNGASTSASLSDKSRAQMKAEIRTRAEKLYVIRSLPLGLDRRHNRYWQFAASAGGEDPGRARIYFECNEDGHFEVIDTEEALDALMSCLDTRGVRESSLYNVLAQISVPLRKAMKSLAQSRAAVESSKSSSEGSPSSGVFGSDGNSVCSEASTSAICVELGRSKLEIQHAMARFKDLDRWVWNRCLVRGEKCSLKALSVGKKRDDEVLESCEGCHGLFWPREKHCPSCHAIVDAKNDVKFAQHLRECEERIKSQEICSQQVPPSRLQLLKHLLLAVEVAVPADAFKASWTSVDRRNWCCNVKVASSASEVLQAFTELEAAVDEQWISSSYETTEKALSCTGTPATTTSSRCMKLPWIPQTTAAVALRLCAFDAAVAFNPEQRLRMEESFHRQPEELQQHQQQQDQQTPSATRVLEDLPPSSPDSDSPPDFQNGHARLPPRPRSRIRLKAGTAQQQKGQKHRRLSFRVQGRSVAAASVNANDGFDDDHHHHYQQPLQAQQDQHEQEHHQPPDDDDEEDSSDESEESYEQEPPEAGDYYRHHQQEYDERKEEFDRRQQQQEQQEEYNNNMGMGAEESESEEEDDEEEQEQQEQNQQHEEEDEEDDYEYQQQQQQQQGDFEMMIEEDEEVELEEVDEEDLSDESS